jgi:quercetin dioxygenase-like cupin family protein
MRTRLIVAAATALLAVVAVVGSVTATMAIGVTSTTLATGTLHPVNVNFNSGGFKVKLQMKDETSVQVVQNVVAPGGTFGWHSHPGPSLIVVKSGTMTFYHADDPTCSPDVRHAGDALIDSGTDVHVGRNLGTVDAVVIVTRFLPIGAPSRIDEPASPYCNF